MNLQNDPELSEAVSKVIQEAGRLNELMREGKISAVRNTLNRIGRFVWHAECLIVDMSDFT